jgi:hypothetical protein
MFFTLLGHETTANTMSFCLYNLAMDKSVQEKARQEVIKVLGDEPEDVLPRAEELRQIPYLDMVLKEVKNISTCTIETNLVLLSSAHLLFYYRTSEDLVLHPC